MHAGIPAPQDQAHPLGTRQITHPQTRHPSGTRHTPLGPGIPPLGPGTLPWDQAPPWHMVNEQPVRILLECIFVQNIFTGRNKVVAKVMFLHMSVILSTGGGLWGEPPRTRQTPWAGRTPPPPGQGEPPPPDRENSPGTRQIPPAGRTPWDQADTPRTRQTPPRKKTAAYSQLAAGTHPTGMHSCDLWLQSTSPHMMFIPIFPIQ